MKRKAIVSLMILSIMVMYFLPISSTAEGGILPSLTETVGIAMPSLGEALRRYPDSETENGDGSITELYKNVSESDFNVFSVYLQQQKMELADYKAENGILTAEIRAKGATFNLQYDSSAKEAIVTYPSGTFDEWMKSATTHYDTGMKLLEAGKADEALVEFLSIPQYTDYGPVAVLLQKNDNLAAAAVIAREEKLALYKEVGIVVTFGTYPQTEEGTDQTPIEWIVLDYDETNHKALLLSKYGLDAVPYNNEYIKTNWEQCTLRTWLNSKFLKSAFSAKEQSAILTTNVDNSSGQGYSKYYTNEGMNNTLDKIFLLSYAEANQYLRVNKDNNYNIKARVAASAYAIAQGAYMDDRNKTADGEPASYWWLRSPGYKRDNAAQVSVYGSLGGNEVNKGKGVVRPAFWLNLDSDIF